jgi:magnesium-transporting ATPase (P-type)
VVAQSVQQATQDIGSSPNGLSHAEAATRLRRYGPNSLHGEDSSRVVSLLLRQLSSPIVLVLIAAAIVSLAVRDAPDSIIILFIVAASALLGFWQEYRAAAAVNRLQHMVAVRADVLRDGSSIRVPRDDVVPGDVVLLSAGTHERSGGLPPY